MNQSIIKLKLKFVLAVLFLISCSYYLNAQQLLTIEMALDLAEENNPQLRNSKLSFERTQFLLEAQRASLKSQFSMTVDPLGYSINRRFDERYSDWYTIPNNAYQSCGFENKTPE